MENISLELLGSILFLLILLSGFFSSSETSMMSLNPYRLKHQVKNNNAGAKLAQKLLSRPDRLIGVILIGNNFVNILASAIATVIAMRLWGDSGIAIATALLTMVILIFAEVTPKTLAALKPERVAFPASFILVPLLQILYPLVWMVNAISNNLLKLFGVSNDELSDDLSRDELRTVVDEAGNLIPKRHQKMLISILDLEKVTVDDIMIPRSEIVGIDLEDEIEDIIEFIRASQHTRIPIYKGDINNPIGTVHARNAAKFLSLPPEDQNKANLMQLSLEPYFVPEGTKLHTQLGNFQQVKRRQGLVVDEYGEVKGLVTIEDILEEIVGDFTTDMAASSKDIHPQDDGTYIIDCSATIREINRALKWDLPIEGPKTLNGLIVEHLESIPTASLCIKIETYAIEIKQIKDNQVKTARVFNLLN